MINGFVAQINLIMTALAIRSFLHLPSYSLPADTAIRYDLATGVTDIIGLVAFLFIAILALIATGRFAGAIVAGAGGFGDSIRTVAHSVARLALRA